MTVTFSSPDNEFAAATGSNVNYTSTTSIFDNPPNAFKDLVITSNVGDPEPYIFDLGDTYDITYGGHGGGGVLEDAEVVRSDALGSDAGIVVFEGTDSNTGEIVQLIWTPGFDLEGWYASNYNPSMEPQFYVVDNDANTIHTTVCLAPETPILTPDGLRRLDRLRVGEDVETRDRGAQKLTWIGARSVVGIGAAAPVLFETGAIGNVGPLLLSQQHRVMVTHPVAELYFGQPEVLVPAKSMINGRNIRLAPCPEITWMNLMTNQHDIVQAQGAAVETLFLGEVAQGVLQHHDIPSTLYPTLKPQFGRAHRAARPMLRYNEANMLLAHIEGRKLTRLRDMVPAIA